MLTNQVSREMQRIMRARKWTPEGVAQAMGREPGLVAAWEKGEALPAVGDIVALAAVLGVTPEFLIYGGDEKTAKDEKRRSVTTVFALLTAVFIGVGAVILFLAGWQKFPDPVKVALSFVPILIGQFAGVFTLRRYSGSLPAGESAAVLWCAGCAGTVAMLSASLHLGMGVWLCLLLDAILFLSVAFVMRSAAALAAYITSACVAAGHYIDLYETNPLPALLFFLAIGLAALFVFIYREMLGRLRFRVAVWQCVVGFVAMVLESAAIYDLRFAAVCTALSVFVFCLHDEERRGYPFEGLGTVGITLTGLISAFDARGEIYEPREAGVFGRELATIILCWVLVALGFALGAKGMRGKPMRVVIPCLGVAAGVLEFLIYSHLISGLPAMIALLVLMLAIGVLLILDGANTRRLLKLNAGIFIVIAEVLFLIFDVSGADIGPVGVGLILIFVGLIMLVINLILSKRMKRAAAEVTPHEKQ